MIKMVDTLHSLFRFLIYVAIFFINNVSGQQYNHISDIVVDLSNITHKFFFYLGFLSRTFMIHSTTGEEGGYLFNSSLPLPPASHTLRH